MKQTICCALLCFAVLQTTVADTYRIYIDPGHFVGDERTETEIETNLAVGLRLRDLLERDNRVGTHGVTWEIRMSREGGLSLDDDITDDLGLNLNFPEDRADDANAFGTNLFLSIHCNATPGGFGTETFWCDEGEEPGESEKLAHMVQRHMVIHGVWKDRRVTEDQEYLGYHLGVLRNLWVPGCLNEIGFVDNPRDREKLLADPWRDRFAEVCRNTIYEYFGIIQSISVDLEPGWNMVSIPGIPVYSDPDTLVGKRAIASRPVQQWDPVAQESLPVKILRFGEGYWVYSVYQDDLPISFYPRDEYTIDLERGYNIIGSVSGSAFFSDTVHETNRDDEVLDPTLWIWRVNRLVVKLRWSIEPGVGYVVEAYEPTKITVSAVLGAPNLLPTPKETQLLTNYPNPFNPETWLPFHLKEAGEVTVSIHTVSGHLIRTLNLGHLSAGSYTTQGTAAHRDSRNEHGTTVASGIYFYTLETTTTSFTRKMLLLK